MDALTTESTRSPGVTVCDRSVVSLSKLSVETTQKVRVDREGKRSLKDRRSPQNTGEVSRTPEESPDQLGGINILTGVNSSKGGYPPSANVSS